eukprot:SAG31_NODE_1044_length_10180_cov_64.820157_5_plen_46_part_00
MTQGYLLNLVGPLEVLLCTLVSSTRYRYITFPLFKRERPRRGQVA